MTQQAHNGPNAMEALYPFLYADESDLSAVLAQVRASTVAKTQEIMDLRRTVAARDGDRLANCAEDMAARFAAGGRLFAFGNGGSATDAQQLATLFLNPGEGKTPLPAFGLAGYEGGRMAELDSIDYLFVAPSSSVHRIQEAQTTMYHILWELTLAALDQVQQ